MSKDYPYPIARIGLIGGGQLGRMLVRAAKQLGCTTTVLDLVPDSPAGQIATHQIVAGYHDAEKIRELAQVSDVLTFELENIDADTLAQLELQGHAVHPSAAVLKTVQDKLTQKQCLLDNGIPTSRFAPVESPGERQFAEFGYPLVQKARRGGYDGRGVSIMRSAADFGQHLPVPSLIEEFVDAEKEIAVLVARSTRGQVVTYPAVEMCFRAGENVLDLLLAPADIPPHIQARAKEVAVQTVQALAGVGIFGVEMFVRRDGEILVNEIAPRTHNSGHHTIEANVTDQFEQHLRAILGLPLGSTEALSPAAMVNLLGAPNEQGRPVLRGLEEVLAIPGVCLHLYGKAVTAPFRKMGHITILDHDIASARAKANQVRNTIEIGAEKEQ